MKKRPRDPEKANKINSPLIITLFRGHLSHRGGLAPIIMFTEYESN